MRCQMPKTIKEFWVAESTTYFGSKHIGFISRKDGELFVENELRRSNGYDEKIVDEDKTTWVETSNGEDVYLFKVKINEVSNAKN